LVRAGAVVAAIAATVVTATTAARAAAWCTPSPPTPAVVHAAACWDSATASDVLAAVSLELSTYDVRDVRLAAGDGDEPAAVAIHIDGMCGAGDDATVRVTHATRSAERRVPLADVTARERPRMLALAIGELFATPCPAPPGDRPALVAATEWISLADPPAAVSPTPIRVRVAPRRVRVVGAAELAWFASPGSLQRGASIVAHVRSGSYDTFAGAVVLVDDARDDIGTIDLSTVAARAGAARALLAGTHATLAAHVHLDAGVTFGAGHATAVPASGATARALYTALRAGLAIELPVAGRLEARAAVSAGYGRGLVAAADERELATTGGWSLAAAAGIGLAF